MIVSSRNMYFQEHLRKPSSSDMIGTHLAHRSGFGSKGLKSLITKPEYHFKPTRRDYDIAFRDFARDYNRRGFNCLDCSPMGCMRDERRHWSLNVQPMVLTKLYQGRNQNCCVEWSLYKVAWNSGAHRILLKGGGGRLSCHLGTTGGSPPESFDNFVPQKRFLDTPPLHIFLGSLD